jgi:hypothetical protein
MSLEKKQIKKKPSKTKVLGKKDPSEVRNQTLEIVYQKKSSSKF